MDDPLERLVRRKFREAGRQYARARDAYRAGRTETTGEGDAPPSTDLSALPRDEEGRVRLVCRRYAERRAVDVDDAGRPECFEADHPDCEGCLADVDEGIVETW
ncbi:MAG: hypothetical protein ABEK02_06490 [Haloquadratum sp.]